ncbi:protoporphyrinogen/coproporphyrinogen oxidase [Microbacterium oleivorans]|uniref:protoporphyrinogen/coproporphyrinogen oxidase n=1 Tax=Microbacterium oleivorans TaxID=273677 RepID=UPI00203ECE80|nr:FAD-dependent oxidoreductase [Microbacterium oleivorans]MCM3696133.1 FAD-dependent oxidoreductase [Microbacterium oleivorans]
MTGSPAVHDVVIVGGGVAALTAAWELAGAGRDVVVLEAGDAVGGMLRRGTVAGVAVDLGAESFATRTTGVADLVADARLAVQLVEPRPGGAHVAFRRRMGRVGRAPLPRRALIGMPADAAAADVVRVLGRAGARRAARERDLPVDPAVFEGVEPSLAELATARFGAAVTARLVEPLCASVYSQRADAVTLSALHPALWGRFQELGSLTAAVDALATHARAGSAVRGVEGGLWRLAAELEMAALRAGAVIRTGATVREIRTTSAGADVVLDGETLVAREVVVATGPASASRLLGVAAPVAAPVRLVVAEIASAAFDRHPVGSGVIAAPDVPSAAKALTHVDAKWEWAAAALPAGAHAIRLSARDAAAGGLETPAEIAAAVRTLTGVGVNPADVREIAPVSWSDAVVTPEVKVAAAAAAATRGIRLLGAVASGTGLASVIPHARAVAAELLSHPTPSEGVRHVR